MEKLLLRPSEAGDALGVGRSKIYALLKTGEIPSIRLGGSLRVPAAMARIRESVGCETVAVRCVPKDPGPVGRASENTLPIWAKYGSDDRCPR